MKLDHDLVRELLLNVQSTQSNREAGEPHIEPWSRDTILEHIEVLDEAGLLEARVIRNHQNGARLLSAHVIRLTWEGHEFLGKASNDLVWARVKIVVVNQGGSASIGILKELLTRAAIRNFAS